MVLHTRGRVGRRQLFLQASFNRFVERGFFCALIFGEAVGASSPKLGVSRPHLGATRPRVGIAKLGFAPPTWQ